MSDHDTGSRPDPYTVPPPGTTEQHPEATSRSGTSSDAPEGPSERPPTDDERKHLRRRALSLSVMAGLALVSAVFLPPVGLLLGIVTVVQAVRFGGDARRIELNPAVRGVQFGGGITAIVVGLVLSIGMAVLWDELTTYQSCQAGAQTHVALERCQNELMDDLEDRFG